MCVRVCVYRYVHTYSTCVYVNICIADSMFFSSCHIYSSHRGLTKTVKKLQENKDHKEQIRYFDKTVEWGSIEPICVCNMCY